MLRADHPAIEQHLADLEVGTTYRYRDELFAWTLVDLWNGRGAAAQRKHDIARTRYRDDALDPVMHFAALRLPDAHSKDQALQEGARLLEAHPMNRWLLLAQGYLLQQRGRMAEGSKCFEDILELPNQEPDFLNRLFRAWSWMALAQMSAPRDAGKARAYFERSSRAASPEGCWRMQGGCWTTLVVGARSDCGDPTTSWPAGQPAVPRSRTHSLLSSCGRAWLGVGDDFRTWFVQTAA